MVDRHQPDEDILLLIKLGFHGFVEHANAANTLPAAVRAVTEGRLWFSEQILERYIHRNAEAQSGSEEEADRLTIREIEVLEFVRRRFSNREIATQLGIREATVKYHLSNVLAKFRVNNRRELEKGSARNCSQLWDQLS